MAEHFQCAAALIEVIIIGKKIAEFPFQLLTGFVSKIKYIQIIGVEGATVQPRLLNQVGHRNVLDLPGLQQFDESFFNFLLGFLAPSVILRVHKNSPLFQQVLRI